MTDPYHEPDDPTQEHIAAECAKIQAGWSEITRLSRAGSLSRTEIRANLAWTPREYTEKEIASMLGGTSYR